MNKTVTVTLNGVVFTLEEDAYQVLKNYLEDIKRHFAHDEEREELAKDIEASIAEKFGEALKGSKTVITGQDVEKLISELGRVDEIVDEAPINEDQERAGENVDEPLFANYKTGRKLYRNPDDVVFAGVCSGLGAFFGIDSVFVRLVFAISIFFGGFGIIMYLILWLVMPEAKTTSQKLEMKGDPVNIKKLEELAKEKTEVIRQKAEDGTFKKALIVPFQFIGQLFKGIINFFKKLFPVLGAIIGVCVIISAIAGLIGLTIAGFAFLVSSNSGFIQSDIPLSEVFSPFVFNLAVTSVYFIALVPIIFILLLGTTLVKRKNSFTAVTNTVLIGLWMIAIIAFGVIAVDVAPRAEMIMEKYNDSDLVERSFELQDFDRLYITESHTATVFPGEEFSIKAVGRERDFERLEIGVDRSQLQISNTYQEGICLFCFRRGIQFEITMPELTEVKASRSSELMAKGFSPDTFRINISGASKGDVDTGSERVVATVSGASWLNLSGSTTLFTAEVSGASKLNAKNLDLIELNLDLSGSSRAELSGETDIATLEASGSSKILAFPLKANKTRVKASGASLVEIEALEDIEVNASGASRVNYRGDAQLSEELSGSGEVEKLKIGLPNGREFEINIEEGYDSAGIYIEEENQPQIIRVD